MNKGMVTLVGAGPGNIDLLTLGGLDAIKNAQVVICDRLVGKNIREYISPSAEFIDVGKRAANHPVPQSEINQIIVREALKGKNVVRLKGGDNFLFGRGGEELEEIKKHQIPFKVIPGVTSAIAAPAYGGIPVTHRDYCSSVHIITGHARENGQLNIDYRALVALKGTLVFLMSVSTVGLITQGLISNGMSGDMPCAIIENGTLPTQRKLVSTISKVEQEAKEMHISSPAVIVVGKVCTLSQKFDWFSNLPLKGKRILVTRPNHASHKLRDKLLQLGADVTSVPAVTVKPISFAMPDLSRFSSIVFTSAEGVDSFFNELFRIEKDSRVLSKHKIAAVGKATAKKLQNFGIVADFTPSCFSGEILAKEMIEKHFIDTSDFLLMPRGNLASKQMNRILEENQISHEELIVYETISSKGPNIILNDYDIITFTSTSCVESTVNKIVDLKNIPLIKTVCIGKQTALAAKKAGFIPVVSKEATISSMIDIIKELLL